MLPFGRKTGAPPRMLPVGRKSGAPPRTLPVGLKELVRFLNDAGRQKIWSASVNDDKERRIGTSTPLTVRLLNDDEERLRILPTSSGRHENEERLLEVNQLASSKSNDSTELDLGSRPWYASLSGSSE